MDEVHSDLFGVEQTGFAVGTGAGQHGFSPTFAGNLTISGAVGSLWAWLNEPFQRPLSPVGLALIVGAILIAVILWNFILYHIRIAAEAL